MANRFAANVSAVGALGGALDGTPVKRKRSAAKKVDPNSAVATAVRCECGDQFDDFRTAWLHVYQGKCEVLTNIGELRDSAGRRLIAECGTLGGRARHRRHGEPDCDACRAAKRDWERERLADPVARERQREYHQRWWRERRMADPEYLEQQRKLRRDRDAARRRADPEFRAQEAERKRVARARKKAEQKTNSATAGV